MALKRWPTNTGVWDLPGGPVVRTPSLHCRGRGFKSLVRELRSYKPRGVAKTRKKERKKERKKDKALGFGSSTGAGTE